jgi:ATP-dependent Lhr-like helicase
MIDADVSKAFELLHPGVQKWMWLQRWTELRDVQELAVEPILRGDTDVIIAASTAAGKTEAAFLPIASALAQVPDGYGLVVYVSPLKALINDQYRRLGPFFEHLDLAAFPWHGDVGTTVKRRFRSEGRGLLLITPESLEALFVSSGHHIHHMFRYLRYVVIDELHSFIGVERGKQLQSLLHRLETAIGREVPRIGLSATLGELRLAAEYLRPSRFSSVRIIESSTDGQKLELLIRGYEEAVQSKQARCFEQTVEHDEHEVGSTQPRIAEDLFRVLRGATNLVFANSRRDVESYADLLRSRCEQDRVTAEFWPHHGSLAKKIREDVEETLKDKSRPATAICTSTLELGIDIGSVKSVAQIGSPFSVASLRQRLGRSGRRSEPAILRLYIAESQLTAQTAPVDAIRAEMVQSIAIVRLVLGKWCEPPETHGLHLSTLVHQVLSLIAEKGEANILIQADDGTLLLAPGGEKVVNHYSFYTVFQTPNEYRIVTDSGKSLGTLPVNYPVRPKMLIIFAGQRWRVLQVDGRQRVIQVAKAAGGKVPRFSGSSGSIHDRVRQEMRTIYEETDIPVYLDPRAAKLFAEGRQQFYKLGLHKQHIVARDGSTFLFLWRGDRVMNTISGQLRSLGLNIQNHGIAIEVHGITPLTLSEQLKRLVDDGPADAIALARTVPNKEAEKFHSLLTEELLSVDFAASKLDTAGAWEALSKALG